MDEHVYRNTLLAVQGCDNVEKLKNALGHAIDAIRDLSQDTRLAARMADEIANVIQSCVYEGE